jgi:hypothetical protein
MYETEGEAEGVREREAEGGEQESGKNVGERKKVKKSEVIPVTDRGGL